MTAAAAAPAARAGTFTAGFVGASTNAATAWVAERSKGARAICVPFAGSGKDIAAMALANPGSRIDSWDVQRLSRYVVDGVFAGPGEPPRLVTRPILAAGTLAQPTRGNPPWPDEALRLWHGIHRRGTEFELAALVRATVRCTFQGKLTAWKRGAGAADLWEQYERACRQFEPWAGLPATFSHTEGSFFERRDGRQGPWDVVQVDPPKVTAKTDVYSHSGFAVLNAALGGGVVTEWREEDVLDRLDEVFELPARRIVFLYAEGLRPGLPQVEELLQAHGRVVERCDFPHRGRTDVGFVVEK